MLFISILIKLIGVLVHMTLGPSDRVLIPDWEQALQDHARTSTAEARAAHDQAALLEQLAVD